MVWSFSKLTLQFLVASRVNVIWLTCYDFWKRGGQQLAKTSILTLFLGDQAQSTSHQECMVEVDKKMCPSGDHPFLASRLLLLQCQSKNAFEQKNKNPIILPERSTLFSNSHFCLKVNYYTSIFGQKGRFCHSVDLKRRPKDEKCYKNIFCMNIEFSDNAWKCIDLLSQVNLGFDLLIFVMLSKSILQQERKLLVAKKMTLHSHG